MEFLQLKKDDAIKAFQAGTDADRRLLTNLYGKSVFHRDPLDYVTTIDDVFEATGVRRADYEAQSGETAEEVNDKAYKLMRLIYALFNGDWKPDFADKDQPKFYPWFKYDKSRSGFALDYVYYRYDVSDVGARLCAKNEKIVQHICRYFLPQYNAYLLS